jgi:hypothetical protein
MEADLDPATRKPIRTTFFGCWASAAWGDAEMRNVRRESRKMLSIEFSNSVSSRYSVLSTVI